MIRDFTGKILCVFSSHFCSPNFHGFLVCGQLLYLLEWSLSNYFLQNHMIMQKTTVVTHHEIRSFKTLLTTVCCNFFIGYRLVSHFDHFILQFFNSILATHLLWHSVMWNSFIATSHIGYSTFCSPYIVYTFPMLFSLYKTPCSSMWSFHDIFAHL